MVIASLFGINEIAELLIAKGADIIFKNTHMITPLGAQPPQGCVSTNSTTSALKGGTKCKIVLAFTSGFLILFNFKVCLVDLLGPLHLN